MLTEPTHTDEKPNREPGLAFAKALMQRKREEQARMVEEFQTDPDIIAAFNELKRQNEIRGTCIVEL